MLVALQLLIQAGYHQFQVGKLLLILDHDGWSDRHQLLWLLYSNEKKKVGELAEWCVHCCFF
jgi:hypothetical protein